MATTNSAHFSISTGRQPGRNRDLAELITGFFLIMIVLWIPQPGQLILGSLAFFVMIAMVMARRPTLNELGLGWKGLLPSLWIAPAAVILGAAGVISARAAGVYHPLAHPGFSHVYGYVIWTIVQQFLLQDLFMPRLRRLLPTKEAAITVTAVLFSLAHMPNLMLAAATVIWGAISCVLFLRYRNLYMIGIAQGILGLCFAVCVPNVFIHHMRVGLGFYRYHAIQSASQLH